MVQVAERGYDGSIKKCRIHDLLRDLAIKKAKDDNFFIACSKINEMQNCSQTPRLGIHVEELFDKVIASATPNLRSLLCFTSELMPKVSQLTHLKVLSSGERPGFIEYKPNKFGRLNQLRYIEVGLMVESNDVYSFQKFIGGMKFLQTLNLSDGHILCDLPDCVWHVKTLRHVLLASLWGCYIAGPPPSVDLINLQTLEGVKSRESWEASALPKLSNLKSFDIKLCNIQRDTITTLLVTLEHLISLKVDCHDVPFNIIDMRGFPFYRRLQNLRLRLNFHKKITLDVGMLPVHLTVLYLHGILSEGDPMPVLEKLENLRWLRLSGKGFQQMCCSAGGFVQLGGLSLELKYLEEWEIEEGALPMLKSLHLMDCDWLRVPLGLQHLTVLQDLSWVSVKSISKTKENEIRSICKHVPSIYIFPVE